MTFGIGTSNQPTIDELNFEQVDISSVHKNYFLKYK
jgi:hypothetical protein